jgi:hypothetical protein
MARANWPTHYLAMTAVTGPSEAWFLTGYPSFAAWEKDRDDTDKNTALTAELDRLIEKDGELLTNGRSLVAFLREDLSAGGPVDIPKMRYFRLLTFRVRQGPENEKALAKLASDGYASVESNVFAFSPAMSYPSKEFVARDPEFWTPKAADKK